MEVQFLKGKASSVTAVNSNADYGVYADLIDIATNVLYHLLRKPHYVSIAQSGGSKNRGREPEQKISERVAEYFLGLLLS
jgi:hypothetical protein